MPAKGFYMIKTLKYHYYQENQLPADRIVLLFFWAEQCGASRILYPVIRRLEDEYQEKIYIGTINIDREPELVKQMNITATPTILVIGENTTERAVGAKPIAYYRKMIRKASENI